MRAFLSYASEDRATAHEVRLALLGSGVEVFMDEASLSPGQEFHTRIRESLSGSDVFVFLISPNSVSEGKYTLTELELAKQKWSHPSGSILPVLISPTSIDLIDPYLRAVTILEPRGSVAAEVTHAVTSMLGHTAATVDRDPSPSEPVRYFVYASQVKLDMLFPQVPQEYRPVSGEASMSIAQKCAAIARYLSETRQSSDMADQSTSFVADSLPLKYGVVREYAADLAFFGNRVGEFSFGMVGSSSSLIGHPESAEANHAPYYYTLGFLNRIADQDQDTTDEPPYFSFKESIDIAIDALPSMPEKLEFVAKVLHRGPEALLATPLYVALAGS